LQHFDLAVENGDIFVAHDANRGRNVKSYFKWLKTTTYILYAAIFNGFYLSSIFSHILRCGLQIYRRFHRL